MWKRIFCKTYAGVSREQVWSNLTNINQWPTWHGDLDYCQLQGAFEAGASFILKPKKMRPVTIRITEVNEGRSFTDCTTFFGAKMYDTHTLEETPTGLMLTNTMIVTGPLRWLWIKLVAQYVANTIPEEMDALIRLTKGSPS